MTQILHEVRTDLIKISTYAQKRKISATRVYQLAKTGKVKLVIIDGVKFVKVAA